MYTDEELIESLQRVADDLGRTPSTTDWAEYDDVPSRTTLRDRFGSWNEALEAANLEKVQKYSYSRSELLESIQAVADDLDRAPTREEYDREADLSSAPIEREFGSWKEGVRQAGLEPADTISRSELIEGLREFANYYGRGRTATPTKREMDASGPHAASTYESAFGSWTEAVVQAGLNPETRRIPREDLLAELQSLAESLGKRPTWSDMESHGKYSGWPYLRAFGSWNSALVEAEFDPPAGGRPPGGTEYSTGDLIAELRGVAKRWGRAPTEVEFNDHRSISSTTYSRRFGSWRTALERAGLEAERDTTSAAIEREFSVEDANDERHLEVSADDVEYLFRAGDGIGDRRSDMVYEISSVSPPSISAWPIGFRGDLRREFDVEELRDGLSLSNGRRRFDVYQGW